MKLKLVLVTLALSTLVACGAPTATPAANAPTSAPAATAAPEATAMMAATTAPEATAMMAATAAPEATAMMDATAAPEATAMMAATTAPEATAMMAATAAPEATAMMDATAAPEATAMMAATAAPEATAMMAATAAPEATAAPAATAAATQTAQKVTLVFTQIDDAVSVKVNNTEVFTHAILRYNQPKVEIDLTDKLVAGANTINVTAKNGLGSATLVGTLTNGDQVVKQWNIIGDSRIHNAAFVDDSFPIEHQGAAAAPVAIQVAQCNTDDIAAPKQAQATLRFTNSSGSIITIIWRNTASSPAKLVEYAKLADGKSYQQESYVGHEWLLNDQSGNTLLEYKVTADQKQCVLIEPAK